MPLLRIAQAQINLKVGDLAGNAEIIIDYMERARRLGADLVTFPELAVTGYPPEDLLLKPRFLQDAAKALEQVAAAAQGITAWVGCVHAEEEKVYNAAAVLNQGRVADYYHKIELPNYGVFDEARYFAAGRTCHFLELDGARLLLSICEDIWVEDGPVERCAKDPLTQAVINVSGSPFFAGKLVLRQEIVTNFARRTGTQVFYNNLVGGQDELIFDGGSLVVASDGKVCAQAKRFEEDLLVYDLELPAVPDSSFPQPINVTRLASSGQAKRPEIHTRFEPPMDLVEEIYHALVLGTRDYLAKTGFKRVELGLSGGIDSALTAA